MKNGIERLKHRWLLMAMVCLMSLGAVSTAGCAGRSNTSTVTTQSTSGAGSTTSVTTQKEVSTEEHPRGVIGGIFYTIGQVLIWPFKVLGSLFS